MLLELDGIRVLTDPVLRQRIGPLRRIATPLPAGATGRVDCVLLSHLHADHADLPTLRRVARFTPVIAPRPAARWLRRRAGLGEVHELQPGDEVAVGGLRVIATPAAHDGNRRPFGPAAQPIGYVVRGSRSAYFAGDTDLFAAMADLQAIDLALLPVWGWGPRLGPGHLDPQRAARAAAMIAPAVAIPIHWGTFALGGSARRRGDPQQPARQFAALTREYAPGVQVRMLAPGERSEL